MTVKVAVPATITTTWQSSLFEMLFEGFEMLFERFQMPLSISDLEIKIYRINLKFIGIKDHECR